MQQQAENDESLTLVSKLLDRLTEGMTRDAVATDGWRSAARKDAAKALSVALAEADPARRETLRGIVDRLSWMIEVPYDVHRLRSFKRDLEWLQASVARPRPKNAKVVRVGSGTADFQRVIDLGPANTLGLLGSALTTGAEGALVSGVAAGALAVAARGMGAKLDASTALTILDKALKDTLPEVAPMAMCAWSYDAESRSLSVASAGHRGVWLIRQGTFVAIRPRKGEPLGTATRPYRAVREPLQRGDIIVTFTAGLLEQEGRNAQLLREKDLRFALLGAAPGLQAAARSMVERLDQHCARDQWRLEATATLWECPSLRAATRPPS